MILAMNFDFSWFLTIPGMLITGGVLLLIIALIIFIATSSKKDKNKKDNQNADVNAASQVGAQAMVDNSQVMAPPMVPGVTPPTGAIPEVSDMQMGGTMDTPPVMGGQAMPPAMDNNMGMPTAPVMPNLGNGMPDLVPDVAPMDTSMPSMDANPIPVQEPAMEPLAPTVDLTPPTEPAPYVVSPVQDASPAALEPTLSTEPAPVAVETPPVSSMSGIESVSVDNNSVTEVAQPSISMPEAVAPVEASPVPENDVPVQEAVQPTIYGGASPVVPEINVDNQTHQIYGGANPLENTQAIPSVSPEVEVPNVVPTPVVDVAPTPIQPEPVAVVPESAPVSSPTVVEEVSVNPPIPQVETVNPQPVVSASPVVPTPVMPEAVSAPAVDSVVPTVQESSVLQPETVMPQVQAPVSQEPVVPQVETTPVMPTPVAPAQPIQATVEATAPVEVVEI